MKTPVIDEQCCDELANDCRQYRAIALELEGLYRLLDQRHHELTIITMRMERYFIALHRKIHREDATLLHHFKETVDNVCREVREEPLRKNNYFFKP